jgi:hypothetical protein
MPSRTGGLVVSTVLALSSASPAAGRAQERPIERAEYQVKVGAFSAGSGSMEVRRATLEGRDVFHAVLRIQGGVGPAKVDDRFESWGDAAAWRDGRNIFSRRFAQDQRELGKRRQRIYVFDPERRRYRRTDPGAPAETLTLPTDQPLDDVAMLYFARSLPLKVGDTYTINRYFKADANPIVLRVVRRDTVKVPAGTFATIVVRPTIKTSGLFGEGGEAEIHFSDDQHHTLVQLRSKVRLIGSISLHLRRYDAATDEVIAPAGRRP